MISRNRHLILLIAVLLPAGCSRVFNKRWDNFTAYYNTFFNAQTLVQKNERAIALQKVVINSERPIKLWETPNKTGSADFEKAITKGASVLLNHPKSKWADDALILIGKSYFYLTQYFSAEQKFDESLSSSTDINVLQTAIFWKARVYLETKRYKEGQEFIQSKLGDAGLKWTVDRSAELKTIAVQMLVEEQNFEQAQKILAEAAPRLRDPLLRGKSFFLLGQLSERMKNPLRARDAYVRVNSGELDYELRFKAKMRLAEIERETGRHNNALKLFKQMARDDKNFDIISDLNYEIGRTLQKMGRSVESVEMYKSVLYNAAKPASGPTKAKTYYALGEMARYEQLDFRIASAWYDSAAKASNDLTKLPEGFDAAELSRSFGDYAKISKDLQRLDSLVWLGGLPQAQFDSVIEVVRKQKIAALEAEMKKREEAANTAAIIAAPTQNNTDTYSVQNGFLNYRNPQLVAQGMAQFKAIWGNRPLVDHWRRMEAVRQASSVSADASGGNKADGVSAQPEEQKSLEIDLKSIPFTQMARDSANQKRAGYHYEIGNLFFLSLNLPDSAEARYRKVVNHFPGSTAEPGAFYLLAQKLSGSGKETEAREFATKLITRYPETDLAARAALRFRIDIAPSDRIASDSLQVRFYELVQLSDSVMLSDLDAQVRGFSAEHVLNPQTAELLWILAQKYIGKARSSDTYEAKVAKRMSESERYALELKALTSRKDSADAFLKKDSLNKTDSLYWANVKKLELKEPDLWSLFPYSGSAWDSTRSILTNLRLRFPNHPKSALAASILKEIQLPEARMEAVDQLDKKPVLQLSLLKMLETKKPEFWTAAKGKKISCAFDIEIGASGLPEKVTAKNPPEGDTVYTELAEFIRANAVYSKPTRNGLPAKTTVEEKFSAAL